MIGRLDLGDVRVAGMERARRHHHHGHVDEAGDGKRDNDLAIGEVQHLSSFRVVPRRHARLRQAGMQIDRVRHDGGADDADRKQQRFSVGYTGRERVKCRGGPVDRSNEHLDQVTKADQAHQAADNQFDRPEAEAFKHQNAVGHDPSNGHPGKKRHLKQER